MDNLNNVGESRASGLLETTVLIVGAGPAGQMAALLLSQQGIASTIVERRVERSSAPKAHAANPRTLEICSSLGLPMKEIYELATPREQGGQVQFMSSLSGVSLGALPYERQDDAVRALTPFPLANISQPRFEEILSKAIDSRPDISVLRGCSCTALEQDGDGVTALLQLRGAAAPVVARSRYLLAADGANSRLRNILGIEMDGPEALQHFMMIHFSADLSALVKDNPGILYFLLDPDISATLIAFDQKNNWVLMQPCDPSAHDVKNFSEDTCKYLIHRAVGKTIEDVRIRNISPWTMSSQVARQYRQGRVFLVGDSAHRFPPTGGLGLNTGIGDAQNISWKIAAVEKGWAGDELLDTYERERKTVAEVNSAQSLNNAMKLFELIACLYGADPDQQKIHFRKMCNDSSGSAELKAAIEIQRPHFDSLRLQLGYTYDEADQRAELGSDVDISNYCPVFRHGHSLPHFWVCDEAGRHRSLLDLLPRNRFTILLRADQRGWESVVKGMVVPLECIQDGRDFTGHERSWSEQVALANIGALLIRPDGHIAKVFEASASPDKFSVRAVLMRQLCNPKLNLEEVE
ncbi:MAG: FAD-dependent monooxygenase [Halioglobus sp.]